MLIKPEIRIPLIFLLSAAAWILLSDTVVNWLVDDAILQNRLQTYKGLLFISLLTVMLYFLIRGAVRRDTQRLHEIRTLHSIQRSVFDAMKRAFISVDRDWNITSCNRAGLELFARRNEHDVLGLKIWGLLPLPLLDALRNHTEDLDRYPDEREHEVACSDGEWWVVQSLPFPEGRGLFFENISERKAASLREAEHAQERAELTRRLQRHIERLPIGYIITDKDFRFQYVNPAAEEIFGYSREELMGQTPYGLIIPEQARDFVGSKRREWMQGELAAHGTNQNISRNRGEIYCDWFNTPILSEEGEFQYLISMVQDVTERIRADEALRNSEQRYRAVIEDQNECIVRWLPDGTRTFVNQSYCRFCALDADEMLAINQFSALDEKEAAELRVALTGLSAHAPSLTVLHTMQRKDGDLRKLRWSHRALFGEDGEMRELQSVARDITEQVEAEQRLRQSEERLRILIDFASEGILTIKDGMFASCNRVAANMLGLQPEDVIGRTPEELSPEYQPGGERSSVLAQRNTAAALAGTPIVFEWEHVTAHGAPAAIEVSLGRIEDADGAKLLCFWRDVTERKIAQERLRESREQLRALTARLDQVREEERRQLSLELHDGLGQSLTALKIDISLMKRILAASAVPHDQMETVDSMNKLVDDTLQMTRNLASSLRPALLEEIGLERALKSLLSDIAAKSGLGYTIAAPPLLRSIKPEISLALYRITQEALTNVLRHAHAETVTINFVAEDDGVAMHIDDNGVGIDPDRGWREGALGIIGMRERAEQAGCTFAVQRLRERGTRVHVRVPANAFTNGTFQGDSV
jgi:PAS domain S-box-containing protein